MRSRCEVCGIDTSKDRGRCTDGRCSDCHRAYCSLGGETSPGHGRRWPEGGPQAEPFRPMDEIREASRRNGWKVIG